MIPAALLVALLLFAGDGGAPYQPGTARVTVPSSVLIQIPNANAAQATASAVTVSFNQASLASGQGVRISVKADSNMTLPGGLSVGAGNFSWTTAQVQNGTGINGSLNAASYTPVFEGRADAKTGRVELTWIMAIPPGITRAGTAQINLRWRFEAYTP